MLKIWFVIFIVVSFFGGFCIWNLNPSSKENETSFVETSKSEVREISRGITDLRDGKKYKTVAVGTQVWMAENLNYDYGKYWTARSFCYADKESNCSKYGRLYNYAAVMDSAGLLENRNICPSGWHLPSKQEWETLFAYVGNSGAGIKLKSKNGWMNSGNGTDEYGFSILPGGNRIRRKYGGEGDRTTFWMSVEKFYRSAYFDPNFQVVHVQSSENSIAIMVGNGAFYVRCVKD